MAMQDKEFDEVFRSKLDAFEAEPTSQVWDGIVEGLNGKRRYHALLPYLSIAASIIVLIAAGILLIPQKTSVISKHPDITSVAKTTQPVSIAPTVKADTLKERHQDVITPTTSATNRAARIKAVKIAPIIQGKNINPVVVPESPLKPAEQPVLAVVQQKKEVITPAVPDINTSLINNPAVDETQVFKTKPALIASTMPPMDKQDFTPVKAKRKAHGIGGLLNAVIAAVDKRKDKFIEFTDSDDNETNVMSINLKALKSKNERDAK
jgi:hypothetical protein